MNQATKWFTSVRQGHLTTQLAFCKSIARPDKKWKIFDSRAHSLTKAAPVDRQAGEFKLPNGFIALLPEADTLHPSLEYQPTFVFELLSESDVDQTTLKAEIFKKLVNRIKENVQKV